jgi:hypothetical protein
VIEGVRVRAAPAKSLKLNFGTQCTLICEFLGTVFGKEVFEELYRLLK